MLHVPAEYPQPGSYAVAADAPHRVLRIIGRNADGTVTVSGERDGRGRTARLRLADLREASVAERRRVRTGRH